MILVSGRIYGSDLKQASKFFCQSSLETMFLRRWISSFLRLISICFSKFKSFRAKMSSSRFSITDWTILALGIKLGTFGFNCPSPVILNLNSTMTSLHCVFDVKNNCNTLRFDDFFFVTKQFPKNANIEHLSFDKFSVTLSKFSTYHKYFIGSGYTHFSYGQSFGFILSPNCSAYHWILWA